ncbi:MAG: ATP-grasp domain-containing protein, partial [Methanobacteriaceae archaeon]
YCQANNISSILTESNPNAPNLDLADIVHIVPRGFSKPIEIATNNDIDAVVPLIGIDNPLIDVSLAKRHLELNYQVPVIASPLYTTLITSDKIKTKDFFVKADVATAPFAVIVNVSSDIIGSDTLNNYNSDYIKYICIDSDCSSGSASISNTNGISDINSGSGSDDGDSSNINVQRNICDIDSIVNDIGGFPVVLKQGEGQGGKDIKIAQNTSDIIEYMSKFDIALIERFIDGAEISIEVLSWNKEYLPLVPTFKGETMLDGTHPLNKVRYAPFSIDSLSKNENNDINNKIRDTARKIAKNLRAEGTIDIDFIYSYDDSEFYAVEVNSRPSGTRYLSFASTGISPLCSLIDMATGNFNSDKIENNGIKDNQIKNYFALEIPVGIHNSPKEFHENFQPDLANKPFKDFNTNSFVVHGVKGYERITIRADNKDDAYGVANSFGINI